MGNSESQDVHTKRKTGQAVLNGEGKGRAGTPPASEQKVQLKVTSETRHRSHTVGSEQIVGSGNSKPLAEKISADSGLSSGSSCSPPAHSKKAPQLPLPAISATKTGFDKDILARHSYHNERELRKRFLKNARTRGQSTSSIPLRKIHREGNYYVEVS